MQQSPRVSKEPERCPISILGCGRVGTAFALLAQQAGWTIAAMGDRSLEQALAACDRLEGTIPACSIPEAAARGHLIFLTVSDDAIGPICRQLGTFQQQATLVHCSGALPSRVLSVAKERCPDLKGIASMHPLQTFPTVEKALQHLPGTHCFIEGDDPVYPLLTRFAADLGMTPHRIEMDAKPLYHAAGVLACNYLTSLMDAALTMDEYAGIPREVALPSLAPLIQATLSNILTLGPERALTGPVARRDLETIEHHQQAMQHAGVTADLKEVYRVMGHWAVHLAARKGALNEGDAEAVREALDRPGQGRDQGLGQGRDQGPTQGQDM